MRLESLTQSIGYSFKDPDLLLRALTHRSFSSTHNERLEFLGDSVVGCAIALELYRRFPDVTEGELSRARASLVSEPSLAAIGTECRLSEFLQLGSGVVKTGGGDRPAILADAVEAIVGAAFIDGGFDAAQGIVRRIFERALDTIDPRTAGRDPKTLLQEYLHSRKLTLPRYSVLKIQGRAHEQLFHVECEISDLGIRTQGEGLSRRSAEQAAAGAAYEVALSQ